VSRIDELIAELAPEGVRHVSLSEVAEYSPTRVDAADLDETSFVGVDNLVSDKGGRVDASYPPNTARLTAYEPGDILLGNIRPYLKKVWLATNAGGCSGDVLAVRIVREHRESLDPAFLYYLLSSDSFFAYNMQHAKGAKMPRGNKSAILNYRIPVPPLEVQREIVRVLDQFTQLEAELEAELEARRRQYEHYRRTALTFDSSVPRVALGDLVRVKTGSSVSKQAIARNPGIYPVINSGREPLGFMGDFNTEGDPIGVTSRGAGVGSITWCEGRYFRGNLNYGVTIKDASQVDVRFLYHSLQYMQPQIQALCSFQGIPALNKANLEKLILPVPSSHEQARIANLLDTFDTLVSDLSIGLPAELNARRKQYEYYRDKLLTFEEAAA
jgi:type I restriction enzyme S subunit